ncbi:T9SS type A sorting domain-containing protein [Dysgonomonas sp. OttesenSCG-928-M03]|nr:T9SS type A sorting domain-containing protein [Dysgonomonas sp. OttesenSCG-928-M03]
MKKLLCLCLFICCTSSALFAIDTTWEINKAKEYTTVDTPRIKCRIHSSDQTIHINQLEEKSYIMIFDASGRNIYKGNTSNNSISVTVRNKGVFIIRIQQAKNIHTEKILIK